jgi:UDP-N-acetylglucosamine enolpyruvyl transferase
MKRKIYILFVLSLMAALVIGVGAAWAEDATTHPRVTPTQHKNTTCAVLLGTDTAYEIKIHTPEIVDGAVYGPITIKDVYIEGTDTLTFGFDSYAPIDGVFVFGGTGGLGNFYDYRPLAYDVYDDTNLQTPFKQNISHVSFCWREPPRPPALGVTKDAAGSYKQDITWDLEKTASPTSLSGFAGESAGSTTWTVTATKSVGSPYGFEVKGTITITSPTQSNVTRYFTVYDYLNDGVDGAPGTHAVVTCPDGGKTGSVAPGQKVECSYIAYPTTDGATLNEFRVEEEGYEDVVGYVPFDWTGSLEGFDSGTLSDPRFGYSETISATTIETFEETFECSTNAEDYGANGEYSYTVTNTATLNDNINLSDDATVTVTCTLPALTATKTADGTYDRTITWDLEKTVDPDSHEGFAGDEFTSDWTVTATKSMVENNYLVTGTITITNPAAIPQTFTVSDMVNGTPATVTCPDGYTLAPGASTTCTYSAAVAGAESNTATVSAPGNADVTATASVVYTAKIIGDEEVQLEDTEGPLYETLTDSDLFDYPGSFACSADPIDYTNGSYSFDVTNTATLTGDYTDLTAEATVTVTCTLPALTATKTADGTYDRTITWDLEKTVDPDSHEGFAGDEFTSDWTVTATKSMVENNYLVTGTITITNPAAIPQTFTVSDMVNGTPATVTCPDGYTLAPGASTTCTYSAAVAGAESNTATVSAPGNADVTATASVVYTAKIIGDEEVQLEDTEGPLYETLTDSDLFDYPGSFACSADPIDYTNGSYSFDVTNTATLTGDYTDLTAEATVTVTCTLPALTATKTADGTYDRTITWDLEKTVDPDSHEGFAGDEFTSDWTVTATKSIVENNYLVTGTITITNPAAIPQTFTVSDMVNGTPATVTCPDGYTLAPGASTTCTYSAAVAGAESNTATVSAPGNADVTATASVVYTAKIIGDEEVQLEDTEGPLYETLTDSDLFDYPGSFACSADPIDYTNGSYSFDVTNTATLTGDYTDLTAEATVTVTCTLPALTATKTADGTYDRTITWDLEKTVDPDSHEGFAGDEFTSDWTVTATKSVVENNYLVTGTITITNPAAIPQTFTVSDMVNGMPATVTCPDGYTLAPGASTTCTYSAAVAGAESNTATVSAPGNADVTATASVVYTAKIIGYESGTLKDERFEYGPQVIDETTTVTFPETFTCPTDRSFYDKNGNYIFTETNTAYLNDNIDLKATATVTVNCIMPFQDETAWAANGDVPLEISYPSSNWATYVKYDGKAKTTTLFAGRTIPVGFVNFSAPFTVSKKSYVTITITLTSPWEFENVYQNLKVQDYSRAPKGDPSPGLFAHKMTCDAASNTCSIVVPKNNFYGVHVEVGKWMYE